MPSKEEMSSKHIKAISLAALFGGAISFVLCAIVLLIGAALILKGVIPERGMTMVCIAACAIASFFGARFSMRRAYVFPALSALGSGIAFCLLLMCAAVLIQGALSFSSGNLVAMAAAILASAFSAVLAAPKSKKKSKKRK